MTAQETAKSVYVFDAYGTLFDVHAAVRKHSEAIGPDAPHLSAIWRQKQLEYSWVHGLMGQYVDFWTLTENALDFAFASFPSVDQGVRPALLAAYQELDCYSEVPDVLRQLRSLGAKTAILSNGSPDMLASAVSSAGLGDLLNDVISVEKLRTFKTNPDVYALVTDLYGVEPSEVSFQSSNRWDIAGAVSFGFQSVWINRTGAPDEYQRFAPTAVLNSLSDLPAL